MSTASTDQSAVLIKTRPLLELSAKEARSFFLKHESYCTIDLPPYFRFDKLLQGIDGVLDERDLNGLIKKPRDYECVNHTLLSNKDGRHAWRPLELIHPVLYVSLINRITGSDAWALIRERFKEFRENARIECLSIPVLSSGDETDKAAQISHWWLEVEQSSIKHALEYSFIVHADITDCYGAIYTHSIAWALHTKDEAKAHQREKCLLGNIIDKHIQDMRHGQTNGIPQGSVLMDFIAEMVLGYADTILTKKITAHNIDNYQILRYRDDYRIFVNNSWDGDCILKCLTETMINLGLKLNTAKTTISDQVIRSSIKEEKLAWICRRRGDKRLQEHLLVIHDHSVAYPNAGSLIGALRSYYARIQKAGDLRNPLVLISIVVDIAYRSPKTYPICAAILSKLINCLENDAARQNVVQQIRAKFRQLPNTNHMEIWLQRISYPLGLTTDFSEPLCKLLDADANPVPIWVNDWITANDLKAAVIPELIVDKDVLVKIAPIIPMNEVDLFAYGSA